MPGIPVEASCHLPFCGGGMVALVRSSPSRCFGSESAEMPGLALVWG
ncbi:hypothetical protein [Geitlerinema sp. PCC 9228]|nr:hypothetical protein [Geitlerinema sp. PCC 9228]